MKKLALALILMLSQLIAADNKVFIDQTGSNTQITVNQTGSGNSVGSAAQNAKFTGNTNLVTITQVGNTNTLALSMLGTGLNTFNYSATGNNNSLTFACGGTGNGAKCNNNTFNTTITSSNNTMTVNVNAESITNTLDFSGGNGNNLTMTLNSSKAINDIKNVGATNNYTITQTGVAGVNGHFLKIDSNGGGNSFNITQAGTIDTTVNILSVGSTNTFAITTQN